MVWSCGEIEVYTPKPQAVELCSLLTEAHTSLFGRKGGIPTLFLQILVSDWNVEAAGASRENYLSTLT